jgi:thiol-disulfide isomerase/thioredoxin
MKTLFLITLLSLTSTFTFAQNPDSAKTMPEWALKKQDGTLVRSSDYHGKPLIMHFWATWCPYCKKLQPGLDRIAQKYQDKGLEVIAISFNEDESAQPQTHLKNRGLSLQTLVNGHELELNIYNDIGTPTTFFISSDGKILGSTTQSDPDDPQWEQVANYLTKSNQQ